MAPTRWAADWLSVQEALSRILAAVPPLPAESVSTAAALGRTLAHDVESTIAHPPWDNSGMDGYATRAADIQGASPDTPVTLEVIESVPAGAFPLRALGPGQAARVMTGAAVPPGADSVVRVEHTSGWQEPAAGPSGTAARAVGPRVTDLGAPVHRSWSDEADGRVTIVNGADAGRNVRRRGEDIRIGEVVVARGRVLRPAELGVLAMVGETRVSVHRRPRVAILSNGNELVEPEQIEEVRAGRKIVNSNAHSLGAAILSCGGEPISLGIARDEPADLKQRLSGVHGCDVLVTTAGASVGEHDLMKDVLTELGFQLDFWRVRVQPGSPFFFGRLGDTIVFGLPGNPVSALVTFEILVRPALRKLQGRTDVHNRTISVRLAEPIAPGIDRLRFLRVRLEPGDGVYHARLTGPQGSGILSSLAAADALLVVPVRTVPILPGEVLTALPLEPVNAGQRELGY